MAHAHTSQAAKGQSSIPEDLEVEHHYSAFVQLRLPGSDELRLIELDGILKGPLDHGPSTDLLRVRGHAEIEFMNKNNMFSMTGHSQGAQVDIHSAGLKI